MESLDVHIKTSSEELREVVVKGGKLGANTSMAITSDNLHIDHEVTAQGSMSITSKSGLIRVNAKVTCPELELITMGENDVFVKSEGRLYGQNLLVKAKTCFLDGQIALSEVCHTLNVSIIGNLHISTQGLIGQWQNNQGRQLYSVLVSVHVKGDIQNYGQIVSTKSSKLFCRNYQSCAESTVETVQRGYTALKALNHEEIEYDRYLVWRGTIKALHSAIKKIDKTKVVALLESGADPRGTIVVRINKDTQQECSHSAMDIAGLVIAGKYGKLEEEKRVSAQEILKLLKWWVSMRGEVVSESLEVVCDGDLGDCSQLKGQNVWLNVKGEAVVEEGSFWSCGSVAGHVAGNMKVDGTWKLKQFANLEIHQDLQTNLTGRVIISQGGRITTHAQFDNQETWYNNGGQLCIECDVFSQANWAAIKSQHNLEIIVNNDTREKWFGNVFALNTLKIIARNQVECHANVDTVRLVEVELDGSKTEQKVLFDVAGQVSVEKGPIVVQSVQTEATPSHDSRNIFKVSGSLKSLGLQASEVHAIFNPGSETYLRPLNAKSTFLLAGIIETHEQSLIDMMVENKNQHVAIVCEDVWYHKGQIQGHVNKQFRAAGVFTFDSLINQGMIEDFDTLTMEVGCVFENHVRVSVPHAINITGEAIFINKQGAVIDCEDGLFTMERMETVHLLHESSINANKISMKALGRLMNEGTIEAGKDVQISMVSLDNKSGVVFSSESRIGLEWLSTDEDCILEGEICTQHELLLSTPCKTSLTMRCSDRGNDKGSSGTGQEFLIPPKGLRVTSPLACFNIESCLYGRHGNEVVSIATGNGVRVHSCSNIPNLSMLLAPACNGDHVFLESCGEETLLHLHQVVVMSKENSAKIALKGKVSLDHDGAIICRKTDLTTNAQLILHGSYGIMAENITFSDVSTTLVRPLILGQNKVPEDEHSKFTITVEATHAIDILGRIECVGSDVPYSIDQDLTLRCLSSDLTIGQALVDASILAARVTNRMVIKDSGRMKAKQLAVDVGSFAMENPCTLTVYGDADSGIYVKNEEAHLAGELITEGSGTLLVHSQKDIIISSLQCSLNNSSSQFESASCILLEHECDITVKNELVLKSTMEEGVVAINGRIKSMKINPEETTDYRNELNHSDESEKQSPCCNDKIEVSTNQFAVEGFIIKVQEAIITGINHISLSAENILEVGKAAKIQNSRSAELQSKVFEMNGHISDIEIAEINLWSAMVRGKFDSCDEIKVVSELLLVNSGLIHAKKIGIITPVFLSLPEESSNEQPIVPQLGGPNTERLVLEGMLSICVKSYVNARNIQMKSLLRFDFSTMVSTTPGYDQLNDWKRAMDDVLTPASVPDANMQSLLNKAMEIKDVALELNCASVLGQGVIRITEAIQKNGVQHLQMQDLLGVLGKAHSQYTNIYSYKILMKTDKFLQKIKKGAPSVRKVVRDILGKGSFSDTLKFSENPVSEGIEEIGWISNRTGNSKVFTEGSYIAQSQLWENHSTIEAYDISISSDVIIHRGSKKRALRACHIIMAADDIDVQGLKSSTTNLLAANELEVRESESDQLQLEGGNVNLSASEVTDFAAIRATGHIDVYAMFAKRLSAKGRAVDASSLKVTDGTQILAEKSLNITQSTVESLDAKGGDVLLTLTTARNASIEAKSHTEIKQSEFSDISVTGSMVDVNTSVVHESAKICADNKADVSHVEVKNLDIITENTVSLGDLQVGDTMRAMSKSKGIQTTGNMKTKMAALHASKGTIEFNNAKKHEFEHLSLKQKTIKTKELNDLLNKSGGYSCLKVSDQLDLAVVDHVTLNAHVNRFFGLFATDAGIKVDHGFSLEAKSIDVQSNVQFDKSIELIANEGGINVDAKKSIHGTSVNLVAEKDITHQEGSLVTAKEDVMEQSKTGSINVHTATIRGDRFVGLDAAKDINILAVGGDKSAAKRSNIKGGTGHEYDDNGEKRKLGLKLKAGRNITNDASTITSQSDNMITAGNDIIFKPRSHRYCSKRTTKRGFLGLWSTTTEEWSTHVDRAEVSSTGGRNIIQAERGSIASTATDIKAQENNIIAKKHVTLQDLVTRTEKFSNTSDCFGGLFYRNNRHETQDVSHGTIVRDESAYANTVIMSKTKDINIVGSEVASEGNLSLIAVQGKVSIREMVLNRHVSDHTSGFYVTAGNEKSGPAIGYHHTWTDTHDQNITNRGISSKGATVVEAKELITDVTFNVGENMMLDVEKIKFTTPQLKSTTMTNSVYFQAEIDSRVSLNYAHEQKTSSLQATTGLNVPGALCVVGDTFVADQGYDMNVGGDLELDANSFVFRGAQEGEMSVSHHAYAAFDTGEVELGYNMENSANVTYRNQKINVSGDLIQRNVKTGVIDASNVDCDGIEGQINKLDVTSRQDVHQTVGAGASVGVDLLSKTPTVGVSNNSAKSQMVNEAASLNVRSGGSEKLRVKQLNLTGSHMQFAGDVHNFADCIVSSDLHDISDSLNVAVKVGKPKPKKVKGSLNVGFSHKEIINRATISSSSGSVHANVKNKVNTDRNRAKETTSAIGVQIEITASKTRGKGGKYGGGLGIQSGDTGFDIGGGSSKKGKHGRFEIKSGNEMVGLGIGKKGKGAQFNVKAGDQEIGMGIGSGKKGHNGNFHVKSGDQEIGVAGGTGKNGKKASFHAKSGDQEITMAGGTGKEGKHASFHAKSGDQQIAMAGGTGKEGSRAVFHPKSGDQEIGMVGGTGGNGMHASFKAKSGDKEIAMVGGTCNEGKHASFHAKSGDQDIAMSGGTGKEGKHASFHAKSGDQQIAMAGGTGKEGSRAVNHAKSGDQEITMAGGTGKEGKHASFHAKSGDQEIAKVGGTGKEEKHASFQAKSGDQQITMAGGTGESGSHAVFHAKFGDQEIGMAGGTGENGKHASFKAKSGDQEISMDGGTCNLGKHASFHAKSGDQQIAMAGGTGKEGSRAVFRPKSGDQEIGMVGGTGGNGVHASFKAKSGDKEIAMVGGTGKEGKHASFHAKSGDQDIAMSGGTGKEGKHASFHAKSGDQQIAMAGGTGKEGSRAVNHAKSGDQEITMAGGTGKEGKHASFHAKSGDQEIAKVGGTGKEGKHASFQAKSGDQQITMAGGTGESGSHAVFHAKFGGQEIGMAGGTGENGKHASFKAKSGDQEISMDGGTCNLGKHASFHAKSGDQQIAMAGGTGKEGSRAVFRPKSGDQEIGMVGGTGGNGMHASFKAKSGDKEIAMVGGTGKEGKHASFHAKSGDQDIAMSGGTGKEGKHASFHAKSGDQQIAMAGGTGKEGSRAINHAKSGDQEITMAGGTGKEGKHASFDAKAGDQEIAKVSGTGKEGKHASFQAKSGDQHITMAGGTGESGSHAVFHAKFGDQEIGMAGGTGENRKHASFKAKSGDKEIAMVGGTGKEGKHASFHAKSGDQQIAMAGGTGKEGSRAVFHPKSSDQEIGMVGGTGGNGMHASFKAKSGDKEIAMVGGTCNEGKHASFHAKSGDQDIAMSGGTGKEGKHASFHAKSGDQQIAMAGGTGKEGSRAVNHAKSGDQEITMAGGTGKEGKHASFHAKSGDQEIAKVGGTGKEEKHASFQAKSGDQQITMAGGTGESGSHAVFHAKFGDQEIGMAGGTGENGKHASFKAKSGDQEISMDGGTCNLGKHASFHAKSGDQQIAMAGGTGKEGSRAVFRPKSGDQEIGMVGGTGGNGMHASFKAKSGDKEIAMVGGTSKEGKHASFHAKSGDQDIAMSGGTGKEGKHASFHAKSGDQQIAMAGGTGKEGSRAVNHAKSGDQEITMAGGTGKEGKHASFHAKSGDQEIAKVGGTGKEGKHASFQAKSGDQQITMAGGTGESGSHAVFHAKFGGQEIGMAGGTGENGKHASFKAKSGDQEISMDGGTCNLGKHASFHAKSGDQQIAIAGGTGKEGSRAVFRPKSGDQEIGMVGGTGGNGMHASFKAKSGDKEIAMVGGTGKEGKHASFHAKSGDQDIAMSGGTGKEGKHASFHAKSGDQQIAMAGGTGKVGSRAINHAKSGDQEITMAGGTGKEGKHASFHAKAGDQEIAKVGGTGKEGKHASFQAKSGDQHITMAGGTGESGSHAVFHAKFGDQEIGMAGGTGENRKHASFKAKSGDKEIAMVGGTGKEGKHASFHAKSGDQQIAMAGGTGKEGSRAVFHPKSGDEAIGMVGATGGNGMHASFKAKSGDKEIAMVGGTGKEGKHASFHAKSGDQDIAMSGGTGKEGKHASFLAKSGDQQIAMSGGTGKEGSHAVNHAKSGDQEITMAGGTGKEGKHASFHAKSGDQEIAKVGGTGKEGKHASFQAKSGDQQITMAGVTDESGSHAVFHAKFGDQEIGMAGGTGENGKHASFKAKSGDQEIAMVGGTGKEGKHASFHAKSGDQQIAMAGGTGKEGSRAVFHPKSGDQEIGMVSGTGGNGMHASFKAKSGDKEIAMVDGTGKEGKHASFHAKSGDQDIAMSGGTGKEGNHASFLAKSGDQQIAMAGGTGKEGSRAVNHAKSGDQEITMAGGTGKEGKHASFHAKSGDQEIAKVGGTGKEGKHASFQAKSGDQQITMAGGTDESGSHAVFHAKFGDQEIGMAGGTGENGKHASFKAKSGDQEIAMVGGTGKEGKHASFHAKSGDQQIAMAGGKGESGSNAVFHAKSGDKEIEIGMAGGTGENGKHASLKATSGDQEIAMAGGTGEDGKHASFHAKSGDQQIAMAGGTGKDGSRAVFHAKSAGHEIAMAGGTGEKGRHASFKAVSDHEEIAMAGGTGKIGKHASFHAKSGDQQIAMAGGTGKEGKHASFHAKAGDQQIAMAGGTGKEGSRAVFHAKSGDQEVGVAGGTGEKGKHASFKAMYGDQEITVAGGTGKEGKQTLHSKQNRLTKK